MFIDERPFHHVFNYILTNEICIYYCVLRGKLLFLNLERLSSTIYRRLNVLSRVTPRRRTVELEALRSINLSGISKTIQIFLKTGILLLTEQ